MLRRHRENLLVLLESVAAHLQPPLLSDLAWQPKTPVRPRAEPSLDPGPTSPVVLLARRGSSSRRRLAQLRPHHTRPRPGQARARPRQAVSLDRVYVWQAGARVLLRHEGHGDGLEEAGRDERRSHALRQAGVEVQVFE